MKEQSVFLSYKNSRIHALRFGQGAELLIAFPGFGDRADLFLALQEALEKRYVVYAIDLPYHGATEWLEPTYTPDDLLALITLILERENQTSLTLLGFSLGGRLVQKIFSRLEAQLNQIYLVAPDGIQTRSMNAALAVPLVMRKLLRRILQQPGWLLGLADLLYRGKILDKFHRHFVHFHLKDAQRRSRLLNTWIAMNQFEIEPQEIKGQWRETSVKVDLYFGKKDRIVPAAVGERMVANLPKVRLHLLEGGHRLVGAALNAQLKKAT